MINESTGCLACDECGEEISVLSDYKENGNKHYHFDCFYEHLGFSESLTLENAEKYGEKNTRTVELNGFYAAPFSVEDLNEIIKKHFLEGTPDLNQDIRETAEWDKDAWLQAINE